MGWSRREDSLGNVYFVDPANPQYAWVRDWRDPLRWERYPISYVEWKVQQPIPRGADTSKEGQEAREKNATALEGRRTAVYGAVRIGGSYFTPPLPAWWSVGTSVPVSMNGVVVPYALGHGEFEALDSVVVEETTIVPPSPSGGELGWGTQFGTNKILVSWNFYPGTVAGAAEDPVMLDAYFRQGRGYSYPYRHPGLAWAAMRFSYADPQLRNFPQPKFNVRGRKLLDPRLGLDGNGNPNQPAVYSPNGALVIADYLWSYVGLGAGLDGVDWASVADAADICAPIISDGRMRHEINISISRTASHKSIIDNLRAHIRASVFRRNGKYVIVIDHARASVFDINSDVTRPVSMRRAGSNEIPNRVVVKFPNPAKDWNEDEVKAETSGVTAGTEEVRVAEYNLEGITHHSQAHRQAFYILNKRLSNLELSLIHTRADGMKIEPLDVGTYTSPSAGLVAQPIDVQRTAFNPDTGETTIDVIPYDAAIYNDLVVASATKLSVQYDNPYAAIAPVTAISAVESVYQTQSGDFRSRINLTFTPPVDDRFGGVDVWYRINNEPQAYLGRFVGSPIFIDPAQELVTYYFSGYSVNAHSRSSSGASAAQTQVYTNAKLTPPTNVPILHGTSVDGTVKLAWQPSYDLDLVSYEIRRTPEADMNYGDIDAAWRSATFVARVAGTATSYDDAPAFTAWVYMIRAFDSGRRQSLVPTYTIVANFPPQQIEHLEFSVETAAMLSPHGWFVRRGSGDAVVEHYADGSERVMLARVIEGTDLQAECIAAGGTMADWQALHPGEVMWGPLPPNANGIIYDASLSVITGGAINRNYEFRFRGKKSDRVGPEDDAVARADVIRRGDNDVVSIGPTVTLGPTGGEDSRNRYGFLLSTNDEWTQEMVSNVGNPTDPLIFVDKRRTTRLVQTGQVTTNGSGDATILFTVPLGTGEQPLITLKPVSALNVEVRLTSVSESGFTIKTVDPYNGQPTPLIAVQYQAEDVGFGGVGYTIYP